MPAVSVGFEAENVPAIDLGCARRRQIVRTPGTRLPGERAVNEEKKKAGA
jgi:hypothetical protein